MVILVTNKLSFIFTIKLLLTTIQSQLGGDFRSNGTLQGFGSSAKFSAVPSGLPLKRVNLLGNQLLMRQMFVELLRPSTNDSKQLTSAGDEKGRTEQKGQRKRETNGEVGGCFREKKRRRRKRQSCSCADCNGCGNEGCIQQRGGGENLPLAQAQQHNAVLPVPLPISPQTSYQMLLQPNFSQARLPVEANQYLKQSSATWRSEQLPSQQKNPSGLDFASSNSEHFPLEPQAPLSLPSISSHTKANRQREAAVHHRPHSNSGYARIPQISRKYPLPECYTDDSNFMCCNAQLEETIYQAFQHLIDTIPNFHKCNIQKISNTVQSFAEKRFNTSFEVVTGLTDYASKSHFYSNYICKVQRDSRYVLTYATPRWELEEQIEETNPSQKTEYPIRPQNRRNKNHLIVI